MNKFRLKGMYIIIGIMIIVSLFSMFGCVPEIHRVESEEEYMHIAIEDIKSSTPDSIMIIQSIVTPPKALYCAAVSTVYSINGTKIIATHYIQPNGSIKIRKFEL